jgi:transposase InsO family protein
MNFITKLPTSKNPAWGVKFNSILTIVDRLTKYTMFISFKETTTASVLMYTILQELINNHGLSKEFITDRDKLFTSKFWETLTAELRINHKMLTAYHSQTDGQSKQMNQTVETYLRHYVNRNQNNWVQLLSTAQCTITHKTKPQKKHHFKQIMNINWRYDKNRKHTDHKARKQY